MAGWVFCYCSSSPVLRVEFYQNVVVLLSYCLSSPVQNDPDWAFRILKASVPVAYRNWQDSQLPSKCPTGKSLFWQPTPCDWPIRGPGITYHNSACSRFPEEAYGKIRALGIFNNVQFGNRQGRTGVVRIYSRVMGHGVGVVCAYSSKNSSSN